MIYAFVAVGFAGSFILGDDHAAGSSAALFESASENKHLLGSVNHEAN